MEKKRHSPRVDVHHGQLLLGSVAGNKITSVRSLQMAMGATSSYIPAVKKLQCVLLDLAWKSIEDCILSRTGLVDIVQALRLLSQRQRDTGGVFDADLTLQRAVWYVMSAQYTQSLPPVEPKYRLIYSLALACDLHQPSSLATKYGNPLPPPVNENERAERIYVL